MNLYLFKKNKNINIKREIDGNNNLYSRCIECGFKIYGAID